MESFADEVEDGTLKEMVDKVTEKMIMEANKCIPKRRLEIETNLTGMRS